MVPEVRITSVGCSFNIHEAKVQAYGSFIVQHGDEKGARGSSTVRFSTVLHKEDYLGAWKNKGHFEDSPTNKVRFSKTVK